MPEWAAAEPWWLFAGLAAAVAGTFFAAGKWVGRVNADLASHGKGMAELNEILEEALSELRSDIKKILHWQASKKVSSESPLRLTDIGRKISRTLDLPSIAETLVPVLRSRIEGKQPHDIQELCFAYVRDEYEPGAEFDARIRQCACENGLDRDEVLDALAVELRDRLIPLSGTDDLPSRSNT